MWSKQTTRLLLIIVLVVKSNCDYDYTFDYELYYEGDEIDSRRFGLAQLKSRTTDILFEPCITNNDSTGIITRVRDCSSGITLDRSYYNTKGNYYKIGCCAETEATIDRTIFHYYDSVFQQFGKQNLVFDTITVTIPDLRGGQCTTRGGLRGVLLMHKRCITLIGYLEKIDRNFGVEFIPNGCCPVHLSAEKYFEYSTAAQLFKHKKTCRRLSSLNQSCAADECIHCVSANEGDLPPIPRYPFMARIGTQSDGIYRWHCGGAIISPTFVLTTAQCLMDNEFGVTEVVSVGSFEKDDLPHKTCCSPICNSKNYNLSSLVAQCACCEQLFYVQSTIPYSRYNLGENSRYHDIGLVQLLAPITFSRYIRPAMLPQSWYYPQPKLSTVEYCTVSLPEIDEPPFFHAKMMSSSECVKYFSSTYSKHLSDGLLPELQHCSWSESDEETCEKGSLLYLRQSSTYDPPMFVIHGISSFVHHGELELKKYTVYTRVWRYLTWIELNVWNNVSNNNNNYD